MSEPSKRLFHCCPLFGLALLLFGCGTPNVAMEFPPHWKPTFVRAIYLLEGTEAGHDAHRSVKLLEALAAEGMPKPARLLKCFNRTWHSVPKSVALLVTQKPVPEIRDDRMELLTRFAESAYQSGISYAALCFDHFDQRRAFVFFQWAAVTGHTKAEYMLGFVYETGFGVPQSRDLALKWYGRASIKGHEAARRRFCKMLRNEAVECLPHRKST